MADPWVPDATKGSRLYFPEATAAPAGVTPAYDASWGVTGTAVRRKLQHKPTNSGSQYNTRSVSETSASPINGLIDQYISDPIPAAKTISGQAMVTAQGRSGQKWRTVIKVVSGDGTTVRGVLLTGTAVVFGNAAGFHNRVIKGDLTPVNAQAGDRIVIERGIEFVNTSTSSTSGELGTHDSFSNTNAPPYDADGDVIINWRPWVEFTQPDIWGPPKVYLAGEDVMVAEKLPRTPLRLAGLSAMVAEKLPRTPLRLAGLSVNVMVPKAGQTVKGLYAAGFPETEPRVLLPDGRWVPFRPRSTDATPKTVPTMIHSAGTSGSGIGVLSSIAANIRPTDLLVLSIITTRATPIVRTGVPTGVSGVTWEVAYNVDDRHVVYLGRGLGPSANMQSFAIPGGQDLSAHTQFSVLRDLDYKTVEVAKSHDSVLRAVTLSEGPLSDSGFAFVHGFVGNTGTITPGTGQGWVSVQSNHTPVKSFVSLNPLKSQNVDVVLNPVASGWTSTTAALVIIN